MNHDEDKSPRDYAEDAAPPAAESREEWVKERVDGLVRSGKPANPLWADVHDAYDAGARQAEAERDAAWSLALRPHLKVGQQPFPEGQPKVPQSAIDQIVANVEAAARAELSALRERLTEIEVLATMGKGPTGFPPDFTDAQRLAEIGNILAALKEGQ